MHWLYLLLAILFEICGTTSMKLSHGFTRVGPAVLMVLFYVISFTCLTLALKTMDLGIAYAIWAGLGTALIAVIGIIWFKEPLGAIKVVSLVLVIAGIVGLNLSGGAHLEAASASSEAE
jgi:small multidrug resistance pump